MLVSIASGKGGTGKTTLALLLSAVRQNVTLIDCDVEEPNCHLFLDPDWQEETAVSVKIPQINASLCNGCGDCSAVCKFNAIAVSGGKAMLFDELCHSCGGCLIACKQASIKESDKEVGVVTGARSKLMPRLEFISGKLNVGVPSAVPLIKNLIQHASLSTGDVLLDCPPGASCSMVNAVKESDYCIFVTEPTPFGKHDLAAALDIAALLYLPAGVVINKSDGGSGDGSIEQLCQTRSIPLLAKIPHSLSFAQQYSAGILSNDFLSIAAEIWNQLDAEGGQEYEGVSHCQRQRWNRQNQY